MKTTLELPDPLFRQAKALAASRGTSLKQLFTDALSEKVNSLTANTPPKVAEAATPWMTGFGKLSHLSDETARVQQLIDDEFETIDASEIE